MLRKTSLIRSKSLSSIMNPIKKRFKWTLETRLLLIEAVTMVDGDQASKLQTIEKVMQMLCGTTPEAAAAAVVTIPITQQERWQDIGSRLQSIFDDSIAETRRWSICLSQFVRLQRYLKLMKPHADHSYRRANGKRHRIMTSKLCHMLIKYHAAFRLKVEKEGSGQRLTLRSDQSGYNEGQIRLSNDKRSRAEHIRVWKDQQDGGEDFPLKFDNKKVLARKRLRGEYFPSRNEKVCGRKLQLRLCHKQKGPGKLFRFGKVEHVPIKSSEKSPRESLSTFSLNVCPPHDVSFEHCSNEITAQGVFPSNEDEQLLGEQGPLSNSNEGRPVQFLSNDEKRNRKLVPFGSEHEGGGVDYSLGNDEKTGSLASMDKSLSYKTKGCPIKKYFKWSLETRLLLIEAVAMVDGDHATKLRTVEKAMRMLCGATAVAAAASVATIPFSQKERWQDVASRLPSIFNDSIHQDKRWSICRSQFEKLKQNLKFMKPQDGDSYRKANGKQDPIMTSKLCSKLTECDAAFCVSENPTAPGQQRLSLKRDQKGGEEDIPLSSKKRKRPEKKMRLSNDQKESGERFPMSKERKVCGHKHNLRLCHRQKGPGKILSLVKVKKHRAEDVPIKGSEKCARQGSSTNCLKVSPPHRVCSHQCSKEFTPPGVYPLSNDEQLCGLLQVLLSNDREGRRQVDSPPRCDERSIGHQTVSLINSQEGRGVDSPLRNDEICYSTAEIPFNDDQENHGVNSPLSKNQEGRGVDSPLLDDEYRSLEDVAIMGNDKKYHGVECASFSKDGGSNWENAALNINKTGQEEDTPSSNEKEQSHDSPQLVASRDEEDSRYGHPLQGQNCRQLCGREIPEDRLFEMTDYSRSNVFSWSEESRLQVIKAVMKMESCHLSKMGQNKRWREVAKCLPQKLFWDVDVDELAIIAREQFAEMRRRYLIVKENESTGVVANLKFSTMTDDIIRQMELYDESLVGRPHPSSLTPELCIQKGRWLTKKPRLLRIPKAQRGHGAVVVEIFISPPGCVQDNSSHCFHPEFDSYNDLTGLGEQSMLPYHMEPSHYENRDNFEKLHTRRQYHELDSDYDYRRSTHMKTAAASSHSEEKFNHSEKGYGEKIEDKEQYLDLQGRKTMSSPGSNADWHSEPYYERNVIEESPYRQNGSSSFISRRDQGLDENYSFKNQQRLLCDSQRRMNSGESEYPGWDSTGSQREDLDSASAYGRSKSLEDSEAVSHRLWIANSESKDFLQSDSGEPFQDSTREDNVKRKSSLSADSQWDERDELDSQTSPTDEHTASPYRKKARSSKLYFNNCAAIPSGSPTEFSEAEHDAVAEDAPILDQILAKVDLEFSRLNWWVNHQLFPTGREKITSCIKSASISDALDKRLESVRAVDLAVTKCRQKQILWVLKAELQQVRLRLVDEIEKSSQVVVQEVLQSFKI